MRLPLLIAVGLSIMLPRLASAQTDTILRLDGEEARGRVLTITPNTLRYVPAAPAAPDTLAIPVAELFLVRYANGTRELLHPETQPFADAADLLAGLSAVQRVELGRRDALGHYNKHGAYWGTLGTTLAAGPLYGLVTPVVLSVTDVRLTNFQAPVPSRLHDADYLRGYQEQANRTKRKHAWGGYGTGVGAYAVILALVISSVGFR